MSKNVKNVMLVEEFERLLQKLDPVQRQKFEIYMQLLVHDPEFRKMPQAGQLALMDKWFEDRLSA